MTNRFPEFTFRFKTFFVCIPMIFGIGYGSISPADPVLPQIGLDPSYKPSPLAEDGDAAVPSATPRSKSRDTTESSLQGFRKGYDLFVAGFYEKAIDVFKENLAIKQNSLSVYSSYFLALSYRQLSQFSEAKKYFEMTLKNSPNLKLENDAKLNLGKIAIDSRNFREAKKYLYPLAKKTRNTEIYPDVLYELSRLEHGLKNKSNLCKWLLQIYKNYPAYVKVKDWGEDLQQNKFEGTTPACSNSLEDLKMRLKNLVWAGLENRAQDEMNKTKDKIGIVDPYVLDSIQAQFYLQEGEVQKAYDILKPYNESKNRDPKFLQTFGGLAARIGRSKEGIDAYRAIYKIVGEGSVEGRKALYQAAFLSYQTMEYGIAEELFTEYLRKSGPSAAAYEARWILGWIQYLKGDFTTSLQTLLSLKKQKSRKSSATGMVSTDRILFWIGMNYLRLQKIDKAKAVFLNLTKDKMFGYYSIAASFRLKKMSKLDRTQIAGGLSEVIPHGQRFLLTEFAMPSLHFESTSPSLGEDFDFFNDAGIVVSEDSEDNIEGEDTGLEVNSEAKSLGLDSGEKEDGEDIKDSHFLPRFHRAKDLAKLGLTDWAKWDLFDIERHTSKRENLKVLMREYFELKNYHRSTYISQTAFAYVRVRQGIEGARLLWEYAYPRAYAEYVEKYAKEFDVPPEFVWSIMRTESQFRPDAISPVGALGLMQIMPITGYRVARILKDSSFEARNLMQTKDSIRIWTRYLKRLFTLFDGLVPLVAAGYNAGPHRVFNWLSTFGKLDTDEFIEHIPFVETRNYVKKVISSCYVYSQLYGQKKDLVGYMSDGVPFSKNIQGGFRENWDDI